jgi:hypothetical protein
MVLNLKKCIPNYRTIDTIQQVSNDAKKIYETNQDMSITLQVYLEGVYAYINEKINDGFVIIPRIPPKPLESPNPLNIDKLLWNEFMKKDGLNIEEWNYCKDFFVTDGYAVEQNERFMRVAWIEFEWMKKEKVDDNDVNNVNDVSTLDKFYNIFKFSWNSAPNDIINTRYQNRVKAYQLQKKINTLRRYLRKHQKCDRHCIKYY